jgi:uncharacterized protein (DUF2267 family)/predicted transcriptional regulator
MSTPLDRYRHARMIVLNESDSAAEAALAMRTNDVGCVLVSGPDGVAGMVTDRDLALRVVGEGRDARRTALREIMSSPVTLLDVNAPHAMALEIMRRDRVRRVPLSEGDRVVGMVTFDDLVLERTATYDELVEIVQAQVIRSGPANTRRFDEWTALARRHSRALGTKAKLVSDVREAAKLASKEHAELALETVLVTLARALPGDVRDALVARLPVALRSRLREQAIGDARAASRRELDALVAEKLEVDARPAARIVDAVGNTLTRFVRDSDAVGRKLPRDLRALLAAEPASFIPSATAAPDRRRVRPPAG